MQVFTKERLREEYAIGVTVVRFNFEPMHFASLSTGLTRVLTFMLTFMLTLALTFGLALGGGCGAVVRGPDGRGDVGADRSDGGA